MQLLDAGVESIDSIGSDVKKEAVVESSYSATPLAPAKSLFDGIASVHEKLGQISAPVLLALESRGSRRHLRQRRRPRGGGVGSHRARLARGLVSRSDDRQRSRARRVLDHGLSRSSPLAMATPLRREDVAKVAKLARLRLSDDELDMFTEQLGRVWSTRTTSPHSTSRASCRRPIPST